MKKIILSFLILICLVGCASYKFDRTKFDTIMNDNVLLDEDYKIYNKLISEYPDKKVYGLTKLKYYYEVL